MSQVVVTFEDGTDIYFARQLIGERLATVELPEGIERPKMGPVSTGLGEVFHYVVRAERVDVASLPPADSCANAKPHPEPVLLALARLRAPASEAILVGDSPHDLAAAKAAGARAVAALWGACGREALAAAGADFFLYDVRDVPGLVASLQRSADRADAC
jgi:hypothetical protein